MNELVIRETTLNEMSRVASMKQQIHELHVQGRPDLFAPYKDLTVFADHASAKNCHLLLAEQAGEPVGFVLSQYVDRAASAHMNAHRFLHVDEFCVDKNHQRLGIGKQLMDALKIIAKRDGYTRIELNFWSFNESAKQFYEAVGMKAYRTSMEMEV